MKMLLALALSLVCSVSGASATQWPNGAKAAVVLTYDDALESQLDHAVPALDAAGFKATFFLAGVKLADVERWRAAPPRATSSPTTPSSTPVPPPALPLIAATHPRPIRPRAC